MKKCVKTTVIGSYPIQVNNETLMNNYFNQKEPSWNTYIESAVKDQIKAGIDMALAILA